jgi:hypothetical protein
MLAVRFALAGFVSIIPAASDCALLTVGCTGFVWVIVVGASLFVALCDGCADITMHMALIPHSVRTSTVLDRGPATE